MNQYILFAQRSFNTGRDVWIIQNRHTGETVFQTASAQQARTALLKLETV